MITKFIEKLPYHDEKLDKVYFKCNKKNRIELYNMLFDVGTVARYTKDTCKRRMTYMVLFGKRYLLSYYSENKSITKDYRTFFTYTVKKSGDVMSIDGCKCVHSKIRVGIKNSDYGIVGYITSNKINMIYELYSDTADDFFEIGKLIYNKKKKTKTIIPLIPVQYEQCNDIAVKHTIYDRSMKELCSEYYSRCGKIKEKIKYNKKDHCFETKLLLSYNIIVKMEEKSRLMLLKHI